MILNVVYASDLISAFALSWYSRIYSKEFFEIPVPRIYLLWFQLCFAAGNLFFCKCVSVFWCQIWDTVVITMSFPGSSVGIESTCNAGDPSSIPESGRSPGGGHGNPLQCYCLENPHGQRSLVGYSTRSHKESDMTKRLSTAWKCHHNKNFQWCIMFFKWKKQ